ncbi:MAG: MgtC/SapB family protein [Clostridia bacterium]|nr:MgtC/SapB family protein [Clostridia bacterium]
MPVFIFQSENLLWLEFLLRFVFAIIIGFALGVERQIRLKIAGIRIHVVVAAGSALFTIASIYGFGSDTSRVAAQVVTGIGFIGAGMIMHRHTAVHGLTSAAGIWLTAAVAMTVGAGMYWVALGATVLTILIQLFLHLPLRLFKEKHQNEIIICFKSPADDCPQTIKKLFGITRFTEFKAERVDGELVYTAVIHTRKQIDATFVTNTINEYTYIISIEKSESDR